MQNYLKFIVLAFALHIVLANVVAQGAKNPYPAMAPLDQYLISDEKSEIAACTQCRTRFHLRWRRSHGAATRRISKLP